MIVNEIKPDPATELDLTETLRRIHFLHKVRVAAVSEILKLKERALFLESLEGKKICQN